MCLKEAHEEVCGNENSIILLLVLIVSLMLGAVPVSAGAPAAVSGTWDYALTGTPEVKVDGPNEFTYGEDRGEWGGTFEGYTDEEFVLTCNAAEEGLSFYKGEMTFYGKVVDESGIHHEGTMVLKTNGKQHADADDPSSAEWNGHWVILGGTDGLTDIHGQGTFHGPTFHLIYEGQIHFG